ncbi:dihydroorotate dehydrogenase [bacterium]|nr:dihydroorotate dehydrogenase [bacterium]
MDKDLDLDALFAQAAEDRATLSPELDARILADAARLQPSPQAFVKPVVSVPPRPGFGWGAALAEVLGGLRSVAALSMVGLAGLYLGVAQPAGVQSLTSLLSGDAATVDQLDLLPTTGALWSEE